MCEDQFSQSPNRDSRDSVNLAPGRAGQGGLNLESPHLMKRRPSMHMAILGGTGGGKSYMAQSWATQPGRNSIYFDYAGKPSESHYKMYADHMEEFQLGLTKYNQIALITDDKSLIVDCLELVWQLFTSKITLQEPLYLMLDECQFYSDQEAFTNIFHLGRKYNLFGVMVSRTLADVVHTRAGSISQITDFILVGAHNDVAEKKLRDNYQISIPPDVINHINSWHWEKDIRVSDHNSAYYDGINWDLYNAKFQHIKRANSS